MTSLDLTDRLGRGNPLYLRFAAERPSAGPGGLPLLVVDRLRLVRER